MSNKRFKRVFGIVLDSIGIGEAPDADEFGDVGADTLGSIGNAFKDALTIPHLEALGLGNIRENAPIPGILPVKSPMGYFGKAYEISAGKDSMDGHWEMMGLPVTQPLGFFPQGFPVALIEQIEAYSHRHVIVNRPYSGTDVIRDYGEQQLKTGDLIVYTSGDSVLQIAANTGVIPLAELYEICRYVRSITIDEYRIGRIIARPYIGDSVEDFTRTSDRHDYTLEPTGPTALDALKQAGFDVLGVGKINDIFSGQGITKGWHTTSNEDGMEKTIEVAKTDFTGFCFTNLVDFDAMYGHRRNVEGDGQALIAFDRQFGELLDQMKPDDLIIITADHGNDPGFRGTDHTREYVPLMCYSPGLVASGSLGIRSPFADFGATVLENFGVRGNGIGHSFLSELK
ncbi:phosphopentomutase [Lacticaseibacillus nasuensis]|uniref:phosphopentomutase n=1 Tax=Lacticaseibacillus nasuensis TaxID=944671 RepID=UPI0022461B07|nr:phosphopentomutase [Lacticaseibacillus nasuensis]MCX2456018.1 phosphopentomutase [Lacticaseibacillus nasuensis]